jgi:hypothetical protein
MDEPADGVWQLPLASSRRDQRFLICDVLVDPDRGPV